MAGWSSSGWKHFCYDSFLPTRFFREFKTQTASHFQSWERRGLGGQALRRGPGGLFINTTFWVSQVLHDQTTWHPSPRPPDIQLISVLDQLRIQNWLVSIRTYKKKKRTYNFPFFFSTLLGFCLIVFSNSKTLEYIFVVYFLKKKKKSSLWFVHRTSTKEHSLTGMPWLRGKLSLVAFYLQLDRQKKHSHT